MKHRYIGLLTLVITMAAVCVALPYALLPRENERVHQHLITTKKPPCSEAHSEDVFCTHLPLVVIETGGKYIPGEPTDEVDFLKQSRHTLTPEGERMSEVKLSIFDSEEGYNHPTDVPVTDEKVLIRVRGNSSRKFEKQPYLIKFIDETGAYRNEAVMDMGEHHEWVLNGPYLDKSLVRNYLWYNISGELMRYAPNVRYCELIVDGDYRGVYLMAENIGKGNDSRLRLEKTEKGQTLLGYVVRVDRMPEEEIKSLKNIYTFAERFNILTTEIAIKFPGKHRLNNEMARTIEDDISAFEKAIYSYDYADPDYGYKKWIDIDDFVDYAIINEFAYNIDATRFSTYLYKEPGDKLRLAVWDFNNCCDNYVEVETGHRNFFTQSGYLFSMLMKNREFNEKVVKRYRSLRKDILSEENLFRYIDETTEFLGEAAIRNDERWAGYIESDVLMPRERNVHSREEAISQLKNFIHMRGKWLDENIESIYQYSADSRNKKFSAIPS